MDNKEKIKELKAQSFDLILSVEKKNAEIRDIQSQIQSIVLQIQKLENGNIKS
jgi:hypothetical protein